MSLASVLDLPAHTCGLRKDGRIRCAGANFSGSAPALPPLEPPSGKIASIATGERFVCARDEADQTSCSGSMDGQPAATHYRRIAANGRRFCGITDGTLVCNGSFANPGTNTYTDVALSSFRVCAIRDDGRTICWSVGESQPSLTGNAQSSVHIGNYLTCLLQESGEVVCEGLSSPRKPGNIYATSLSVGEVHDVCAVRASDGKMICWGYSAYGQAPAVEPPPIL